MAYRGSLVWLAAAALATGGGVLQAAPAASEAEVKAAYIYHFTQFVSWPEAPPDASPTPFNIGVIGDDQAARVLAAMVEGESLGARPLKVVRVNRASDAEHCQIIYVSIKGESLFRRMRLKGLPVLTVGETEDFIRGGGMIEFFADENHVKLRINLPAARAASLLISAKLLRVAQVFPPP